MKISLSIKSGAKVILLVGLVALLALAGTVFYAYATVSKDTPEITKISDYHPLGVTQVLSIENGESKVMAEFYKQKRYLVPYDQIPKKVVEAFISAEDSTFFEHQGVNFFAIFRAAIANFLAGQVVQGGSTITQQIAKSLYLSPDRNLLRKVKELFLAFQLEKYLTKEEILYLYLNQIYLGSGSYGVQSAAKTYFHKDLKKLTVAEMALIAGLPTAPGKYSPLLNPKKAKERQMYVLKRMHENKFISEGEQKAAAAEKVKIYISDSNDERVAPHFVEHIRRYLSQKYGDDAVYNEGLTVVVPAAAKYFEYASTALENGLEDFDQRKGFRGPIRNYENKVWESVAADLKKEITKEFFPYRYLSNEGGLDLESAILDYDPTFEKTLTAKKVKALVTQINVEKKFAMVNIGVLSAQIPFDNLKWAYPAGTFGKAPKIVSDVLHAGDEVWVKLLGKGAEGWKAKLIQIPEVEGALYSVDINSGQILAMVGGYDFGRSQFNRAVQAKRQMGSTFKPIIYSAGLERGYTPATVIVDAPIVFEDSENGVWKPENYEEKFYGDTTFRQALIESRNIPTIKIVQDIKVSTVINQAKRFGLEGPFNNDLSISLGSANASLQDMVHAFTAFPLQGKPFRAVLFDKILDRDGRVLETTRDLKAERGDLNEKVDLAAAPYAPVMPGLRLDPRVAFVMTHLMREVIQFGTGQKAAMGERAVAGKTGTTQDFRDAWFMGFSPHVVTGVWVGYDDQRSLGHGETGANVASPIWSAYMQRALNNYPSDDFIIPDGITFAMIDPKTGKRSDGKRSIREAFISGTEPGAAVMNDPATEAPDGTKKGPTRNSIPIKNTDDETLREDN